MQNRNYNNNLQCSSIKERMSSPALQIPPPGILQHCFIINILLMCPRGKKKRNIYQVTVISTGVH